MRQGWGLLDAPAGGPRWGVAESAAMALYLAAVAFGITHHVPWADEAQAWMLAQDVSLPVLLTHSLHYEGTPGLWHSLLKLLQVFHLSFTAARWVAGGVAAGGVAVLLARSPFPAVVRLLLPFSFFLAYQDAVIARSYVLFAVFAFTAAAMLRGRRSGPVRLAVVLGLMAQISLHAAIASGGMAIVAVVLAWRPERRPERRHEASRRRRITAAGLLFAFWIAAAACMAPAPDIGFTAGNNVQRSLAMIEKRLGMRVEVPPPLSVDDMANLHPTLPAVHVRHGLASVWNKLSRMLAVVTYPLSTSRVLGLGLVGLVGGQAWLRPRGMATEDVRSGSVGPVGLVPYLLMVLAFTSLYLAPRHTGMIFTAFVVMAWLTWPESASLDGGRLVLSRVAALVFSLVLVLQVGWTMHALRGEATSAYSPDRMTAAYLKEQGVGEAGSHQQVAGFYYYSVGPLLYFDRNIYFNQPPHRYWYWSTAMRSYGTVEQVLARHPEFIVVGGFAFGPEAEITREWQPQTPGDPGVKLGDSFFIGEYYRRNGYHETHVFCGHSWMRASYGEQICETILEPDTRRDEAPAR